MNHWCPQTIMNIHQQDVSKARESNNNVSAGSSAGNEPTGCVRCGVEEGFLPSDTDQSVSNTDSQRSDASELEITASANTKGFYSVTDKGHSEQVQSDESGHSIRDLSHVVSDKSGLDPTCERLDPPGVITSCSGSERSSSGGQQDRLEENNSGQTAGVCCEAVTDNQSSNKESDTEDTMRNCSCDESGLCYCSSSVFSVQPGNQDVRWQIPRKSSSQSKHSKQSPREMDVLYPAGGEAGEEKKTLLLDEGEDVKRCKCFMEDLVHRIFNNSASICQEDSAKFGEYCRSAIGRQWFARLVDSQRVHSKRVTEQTFYRLVQFFAVCLFECNDADDFTPGKSLMNMCFTFYHEHEGFPRSDDTTRKSFLFSHLTDQPIWKSLRFWNAAFFDAVHQERKQRQPDHQVNWRHLTSEERESTEILNENITFGQLATFLHNMMELELSREMCQEFLDKMATIGNLNPDQKELIQSNISNHFHTQMEKHTKNKKHQRPFNKLSFMRRKVGHEAVV